MSIVIVFDPDELYQEALPSADGSYRLYWQPESYSCCDHYCVYAFAFPGRRNVVYRVSPSWTTATLSTDDGWCVVEPKRSSGIDPQQSFAVSATSVDAAGHSTGLTQETVSVRFVDR